MTTIAMHPLYDAITSRDGGRCANCWVPATTVVSRDVAVRLVDAARLGPDDLVAVCAEHARTRANEGIKAREQAAAERLAEAQTSLFGAGCNPEKDTLPCGHCSYCDRCKECRACSGHGCTCSCDA